MDLNPGPVQAGSGSDQVHGLDHGNTTMDISMDPTDHQIWIRTHIRESTDTHRSRIIHIRAIAYSLFGGDRVVAPWDPGTISNHSLT